MRILLVFIFRITALSLSNIGFFNAYLQRTLSSEAYFVLYKFIYIFIV